MVDVERRGGESGQRGNWCGHLYAPICGRASRCPGTFPPHLGDRDALSGGSEYSRCVVKIIVEVRTERIRSRFMGFQTIQLPPQALARPQGQLPY